MSEPQFPDIGPDPLKLSGEKRNSYGLKYKDRLREALDHQQPFVPDQTALVWRADISQLLSELAVLEGRFRSQVSEERFKRHKEQFP